MCSGHRKHSSSSNPPAAEALLLELAASDDLPAFRLAVEEDGHPLDAAAPWYCRSSASPDRNRMGFEQRTPLMIAALYGSAAVMGYVLVVLPGEATRRSPSDGFTPLHCAAAGGASSSLEAAQLLLDASADVDALDAAGNRAGDLIAWQFPSSAAIKSLEVLLKASPASPPRAASPGKGEETPVAAKQSEKKEYPPDLTMPDIKYGIYSTDEFRIYTFKVKPCSRAYSHDWTECPFVHPGENARRRDPRKYSYSCVPCPEFRKGSCRNGDACEYAHGVFECWLHPAQYRTRLCKDETACNRRVCFFAHKSEELRQVNPMAASVAGMVLPSPRSSSPGLSSMDMATALMLMQQQQQQQQQQPGSPMTPSASSGLGAATTWMNQLGSSGMMTPPSLQLPPSRLKTSLSSRNLDFELHLLGLEGYQQKLLEEISMSASPRASWGSNSLAAAPRASDYTDLMGTMDPSLLNQFQGLSANQSSPRFQSPGGIQSQLLSAYSGSLPSSPTMSATSSLGVDHPMTMAIMNSRASAFVKRSQSFCDRGAGAGGRQSTLSAMTTAAAGAAAHPVFSNWSSPDGKLDWGLQGEELNKLRKSASFGFQNGQASVSVLAPSVAANAPPPGFGEPDATVGRLSTPKKQNIHQMNGGSDFHGSDLFSPWADHEKLMA